VNYGLKTFYNIGRRYHESADAKHIENQLGTNKELRETLEKYPGTRVIEGSAESNGRKPKVVCAEFSALS
jgi:hypothetical protein